MPDANISSNRPSGNFLLHRLHTQTRSHLEQSGQLLLLRSGQTLQRRGKEVEALVFPIDTVLSARTRGPNQRLVETAQTGCEGAIGIELVLGVDHAICDVEVLADGHALVVPAPALDASGARRGELVALLRRYVLTVLDQHAQNAVCMAQANLDMRLARWLLMYHDRVRGDDLKVTHDGISRLLGVRRPGITLAMHALEGEGVVRSLRGLCRVCDRAGLERIAGEIYGAAERLYAEMIGIPFSRSAAFG